LPNSCDDEKRGSAVLENVRVFGMFLWGFGCACLGVGCEYAGQGLVYSGRKVMEWADRLTEKAMFLSEWE
jgi:hypothetical protein